MNFRPESLPDIPHPANPERPELQRTAEEMVTEKIDALDIGLDVRRHPELRARLAEIASHFEDSLVMAKIIERLYGTLKKRLDLTDADPKRLMRAAVLHDIGKSGPAGAETAAHYAIRRLFIPPRKKFDPFKDGRAQKVSDFVAHQGFMRPEKLLADLLAAGIAPDQPMLDVWRRHAQWTYDILKPTVNGDIDEKTLYIAASHHLLENENPAGLNLMDVPTEAHILEVLEMSELLAAVDKYQALRERGGLKHEDALTQLEKTVSAKTDLPETLRSKMRTVIAVLKESGASFHGFFRQK